MFFSAPLFPIVCLFVTLALLPGNGYAQKALSSANSTSPQLDEQLLPPEDRARPTLRAYQLSTTPLIDGVVREDPAWQGRSPASHFTQVRPFEGQPASQKTHVWVGYTETAIYIAAVCYDDAPDQIVVADSRRDSSLEDTDSFAVILDLFHDGQSGLVFGTTPTSVEYDGQMTNQGAGGFGSGGAFNLNWDTTWQVKSRMFDGGWSTEMEIPFKSLRYGGGAVQHWGINFQRNIRRNNEEVYWAPLGRQHNLFRVSDAGDLEGVRAPSPRNLKFTPYVLAQGRRGGEVRSGTDYDDEIGFDAKYSITPSLTLDLPYNTDFAQVEADEIQVNLDRFSLFFPEKRPFFLENAGQFSVGTPREVELFFSRRIGVGTDGIETPIEGGVRVSGKIGPRTNVGFLRMSDEGVNGVSPQNDFTVARIKQELPNRSSVGAIYVDRDGSLVGDADADYNRTYAIDARWGVGDALDLSAYVAATETPGRRGVMRLITSVHGITRKPGGVAGGTRESVRTSIQRWVFYVAPTMKKPTGSYCVASDLRIGFGIHELRPHAAFRGFWDDEGFFETGFLHIDNHWEWRNGLEIHTGGNFTHEGDRRVSRLILAPLCSPGNMITRKCSWCSKPMRPRHSASTRCCEKVGSLAVIAPI